ncbi:MAG TPA: carboxypeptidase-like regulatory domain-containing protein [Polyangiaceae bacterium]|nr:carboxypeptidase-like regulatory domain-containing protein [Polyangiaceae bacterium]
MAARVFLAGFGLLGASMFALSGCKDKAKPGAVTVGSVNLPAPIASSLPIDPKIVSAAVNAKGEAPYTGATGTISGLVTVAGDPAPDMPELTAGIPADCASAKETYGKLFRESAGRGLADVVVGVTGYGGYLPEETPAQLADASGCAWNARTYVLTFGQSLDVRSRDSRPYVPDLLGAKLKAQLVALPRGEAIHLYPEQPGRYQLTDSMRLFMLADVLVVKFPTHAVTGLDGRYVIPRVPVGKVKVSALLPATMAQSEKEVEVHAGELVDVPLTLTFDRKAWDAQRTGSPAPAASNPPGQ